MVLYKKVNGKRIEISAKEEAQRHAKQAEKENQKLAEEAKNKAEAERKSALQISLTQKLLALGLSSDEIALIL